MKQTMGGGSISALDAVPWGCLLGVREGRGLVGIGIKLVPKPIPALPHLSIGSVCLCISSCFVHWPRWAVRLKKSGPHIKFQLN